MDVLDRARRSRPRGLLVLIRREDPSSSALVVEKGLHLVGGGQLRERVAAQAGRQVEIDQLLVAAIRRGPDRRLHRVLQPPREQRADRLSIRGDGQAVLVIVECVGQLGGDCAPGGTETLLSAAAAVPVADRDRGDPAAVGLLPIN